VGGRARGNLWRISARRAAGSVINKAGIDRLAGAFCAKFRRGQPSVKTTRAQSRLRINTDGTSTDRRLGPDRPPTLPERPRPPGRGARRSADGAAQALGAATSMPGVFARRGADLPAGRSRSVPSGR